MYETRKSNRVRRKGMELYSRVFRGRVLDLGAGPDPISRDDFPGITEVVPFDIENGDGNLIDTYFPLGSFDVGYLSQFLEHVDHPQDVLRRVIALVKPGGFVVVSVPDFILYEKGVFPSVSNPDHRTTWGIRKPNHHRGVGVYDLISSFPVDIHLIQLCDTNYEYSKDKNIDQTYNEEDGVEAWCEFVIRKR